MIGENKKANRMGELNQVAIEIILKERELSKLKERHHWLKKLVTISQLNLELEKLQNMPKMHQ